MPPPATMPSSMAARVADRASSMRCFFSLSSISVAAPTLTTATPPDSLASRSCSFSRSQSESVSSISRLIWAMRPLTSSSSPAPSMIVVLSLSTTTLRARPSRSRVVFSSLRPTSSEMTWPPVRVAMSLEHGLAPVAEPGRLDGDGVERAPDLVDDERGQGLALDVLGDDQQRLGALHDPLEHRYEVVDGADLRVGDQDVRVVEHRFLALRVGDEVRRQVALVELHALGELELQAEGVGLLDGDHAVLADPVDGVGDDLADRRVGGGDGGDLGDLALVVDLLGLLLDVGDDGGDGLVDAPLQGGRVWRRRPRCADPRGRGPGPERWRWWCRRRPRRWSWWRPP